MKKILSFLMLAIAFTAFAQKTPTILKTQFSQIGLQDKVENAKGENISINTVLQENKGNIILLDLWASWCKDCIVGMPKLKELKAENPDVKFVYFSMDKNQEAWKNAIDKYQIEGEHYYMGNNWKSEFSTSIDLNWIPRYIIIDQNGKIAKYYAVNAEDPDVQATINKLRAK